MSTPPPIPKASLSSLSSYTEKDAEIEVMIRNGKSPKVMILMCHGLHGTIKDFTNRLVPRFRLDLKKESCMVVLPTCNQSKYVQVIGSNTIKGTKDNAERVLSVLKRILKSHPNAGTITDFVVLGHSFGGIYARYLCKLMVDENIIPKRLKPLHYISIASPHLGIRRKKGAFFSIFKTMAPVFGGTTGKELLLEDDDTLETLADGAYLKALALFGERTCYGNIYNDINVPLCTSTLRSKNPYRSTTLSWENDSYPGVVKTGFVDSAEKDDASRSRVAFSNDEKCGSKIRDIRRRLIGLGWRRVDCKLWGPLGIAHVQIIGQQGGGSGVQAHIANLLVRTIGSVDDKDKEDGDVS